MINIKNITALPEYPIYRLNNLLNGIDPNKDPILMDIGEPKHIFPENILANMPNTWGRYPPMAGSDLFIDSVKKWLVKRFNVARINDKIKILPLSGTREGLFMIFSMFQPIENKNKVLIPNPFYQVYNAGAVMNGFVPHFLPVYPDKNVDLDNISEDILRQTACFVVCSPSNPCGSVMQKHDWQKLIKLAKKYDFVIISDECYSEIYYKKPPIGILEVCEESDLEYIIMFNSLSKRSNVPGFRSGFVVSSINNMNTFRRIRSYAGAGMPLPIMEISAQLWQDEQHVIANRKIYQDKLDLCNDMFANEQNWYVPDGGFFIWLDSGKDGEVITKQLWQQQGVRVLPGKYLTAKPQDNNKNQAIVNSTNYDQIFNCDNFVRIALVNDYNIVEDAFIRIRNFFNY